MFLTVYLYQKSIVDYDEVIEANDEVHPVKILTCSAY